MELILYKNFSKKKNSTKQPTGGTTHNVYLKQGTSVETPSFMIQGVDLDVNYAFWNGHYYFVNDIILGNNNIYELSCTQDVLATYKSDIESHTALVEYSQSSYNSMLHDSRLSMTEEVETASAEQALFAGYNSGSYVLTVVGNGAENTGFTDIWNITSSELADLIDYMYQDDVLTRLERIFNKPYDCIVSCKWIPWNISGTNAPIYLGDTLSSSFGIPLSIDSKSYLRLSKTLTIPRRYGDFRDYSPISLYELYLPFYGVVSINANSLQNQSTLTVEATLDNITGEIMYCVKSGRVIGYYSCNAGVSMNLAQISQNDLTGTGSIAGGAVATGLGIASLATGGAVVGGVGAILGGIASVGNGIVTELSDIPSVKGGQGGYGRAMAVIKSPATDEIRNITLTQLSHKLSQSPSSIADKAGRPLFAVKRLGTLSGYIKCAGASVEIDGLNGDKDKLNSWLNQGFYLE